MLEHTLNSIQLAPVCLFAYNRPQHLRKTIESLRNNEYSLLTPLIIFCDGPKHGKMTAEIKLVRDYVRRLTGFHSIKIIEREQNLGLANSVIEGVTEVLTKYDRVIVLEDDIITSSLFLKYMNTSLDFYKNDERVISIHGYLPPLKIKFENAFFMRGADCWGWATWRRGWALFEQDGAKLLSELRANRLERDFNFDNSYPYIKMLEDQICGLNNSWAIRWYASAFLKEKLTLHPCQSLVQNIGHDGSGTHCGNDEQFLNTLGDFYGKLESVKVMHNKEAEKAFVAFYQKSLYTRLKRVLIKSLKTICRVFHFGILGKR
jgi:glycosyltransferase involved in cell wall biosynthesis